MMSMMKKYNIPPSKIEPGDTVLITGRSLGDTTERVGETTKVVAPYMALPSGEWWHVEKSRNGFQGQVFEACNLKVLAKAKSESGYVPQDIAIECCEMLINAGLGQPGTPNTLWAMVKEATIKLKQLEFANSAIKMSDSDEYAMHTPLVNNMVTIIGPPEADDPEYTDEYLGWDGKVVAVKPGAAYVLFCWYPFSSLKKTTT